MIEETQELEKVLLDRLSKGEDIESKAQLALKDSHALAQEKEREQTRLKKAFKIQGAYEPGSAFDFELQEKQRLEKLYNREKKKLDQDRTKRDRSRSKDKKSKSK